ncbi:hypothetical protein D3C84_855010 [compost metagenome]
MLEEHWAAVGVIADGEANIERGDYAFLVAVEAFDGAHRVTVGIALVVGKLALAEQVVAFQCFRGHCFFEELILAYQALLGGYGHHVGIAFGVFLCDALK